MEYVFQTYYFCVLFVCVTFAFQNRISYTRTRNRCLKMMNKTINKILILWALLFLLFFFFFFFFLVHYENMPIQIY